MAIIKTIKQDLSVFVGMVALSIQFNQKFCAIIAFFVHKVCYNANFVVKTTKNQTMKKFLMTLILSGASLSVYANPSSDQQVHAALCILANQGIHTAASERQAGASKQTAKAKLDKDLAILRQKFKNPRFVQGIQSVWYRALDTVYQKPVYKTQAEKDAFVSGITQEALRSCTESLIK